MTIRKKYCIMKESFVQCVALKEVTDVFVGEGAEILQNYSDLELASEL